MESDIPSGLRARIPTGVWSSIDLSRWYLSPETDNDDWPCLSEGKWAYRYDS
jgi:hypothetical protein